MPQPYTAPPAQPEYNASSPFNGTLQSYMLFGQGSKGLPRDIVHNSCARRYSGRWGTCFGEDPKIIPGGFNFASAADGSANGYSTRFTGGSKALSYALSGTNIDSGNSSTYGAASTLFCVFMVEECAGLSNAGTTICSVSPSPFTDTGLSSPPISTSGASIISPTNPSIGLVLTSNPLGNVYFGFSENSGFGKSYYSTTVAPIAKGHWYIGAVAFYNGTDSFSTPIVNPRRVYLYDLTTATQICGASAQTSQTFTNPYSSPAVPGVNKGYAGTQSDMGGHHLDFVIAPGPDPNVGCTGCFMGQIHVAGIDQQFWDNTGQFAAIPAAFSGVDPFTTFVNDIYGPSRGTYVTGTTGTTIINAANQTITGGNVESPTGQPTLAGAYTTINNVLAGLPSNLQLYFIGDCTVTKCNNTSIEITASRIQGAPAAITSYSLYGSLTSPFTPGAGNLIATQTIGADPLANVFQYTPPDAKTRFYTVIATDGNSNTYTYAQVLTALKSAPAVFNVHCGNSFETSTGGAPWIHFGRIAKSYNVDLPLIVVGFDGSVTSDWLTSTAVRATPFESATYNPLAYLNEILAREATALGRPIDWVHCWLIENNTGDTSSAYNTIMQTMAAAISNCVHFSPAPYGNRALAGGNGQVTGGGTGLGVAIGEGLPAIDNGGSIIVLGANYLPVSCDNAWDFNGAHPSSILAEVEAAVYVNNYMQRFVFPSGGGGGGGSLSAPQRSIFTTVDGIFSTAS